MDFQRHRTEIVRQTEALIADLIGADLRAPVPSCPGWNLGVLVRHIGGGQHWAARVVRSRADAPVPDGEFRDTPGDDTAPLPAGWLRAGAAELAEALADAGPDTPIWAPFHYDRTAFWARRFCFETLVHRADATLAAGVPFTVDPAVAVAAVDEWLELDAIPAHFDLTPDKRQVLGPGRTIALRATDTGADWFVDLTGPVIGWRRGGGPAAATIDAPARDLLLALYRRIPLRGLPTGGDTGLPAAWLDQAAFG